jgi:hypothetical protein
MIPPAPPTPRHDGSSIADFVGHLRGAATALNTEPVGWTGISLVIAAFVWPAIIPDIDTWISAQHVPPIAIHAAVGIVGGIAALLGRWRTFS